MLLEVDAAFLLTLRMISIKCVFLNKMCLFKRRCCLNRETIFKTNNENYIFVEGHNVFVPTTLLFKWRNNIQNKTAQTVFKHFTHINLAEPMSMIKE